MSVCYVDIPILGSDGALLYKAAQKSVLGVTLKSVDLQTYQSTWSSPPIDVEYQALPGESVTTASPQTTAANTDQRVQSREASTSNQTASPISTSRPRMAIRTQDRMDRQEDAGYRRKVSIRPADIAMTRQDRVVRQAAPGRVGVNLRPDNEAATASKSTVVRVLLGVFPFLRHWGGFV